MNRTVRIGIVLLAALAAATGCKDETRQTPPKGQQKGTTTMPAKKTTVDIGKYGFRHDPMKWVENDVSLEGAKVRTLVFGKPKPGDRELIDKRIEQILAEQETDGTFKDGAHGKIAELLALGCLPDRREIRRAVDVVCRSRLAREGDLGHGEIELACQTGWRAGDEPVKSLRALAKKCAAVGEESCCPWSVGFATILWPGRNLVDLEDALTAQLSWIAEGMNEAGFCSYKDPWEFVRIPARVDHPVSREILCKQVPMILRTQRPDGGWGKRSHVVFEALVRQGLLSPLRDLPPLPGDWKIVRSFPAPEGKLWTMTWGDDCLWVLQYEAKTAIAVSPENGEVLKRLPLQVEGGTWSIAWHEGALLVGHKDLSLVDPETGRVIRSIRPLDDWNAERNSLEIVNGKIWAADGFYWVVSVVDLDRHRKRRYIVLAAPTGGHGTDLANAGDGVWHFDNMIYALVKSDANAQPLRWNNEPPEGVGADAKLHGEELPIGGYRNARLLDWGEKPFAALGGIAWDGGSLWVIDGIGKRICMIEKTESGKEITAALRSKQ